MILKYLHNVVFILFVMIFSNNLHSQDQLDFSDLNDKFTEANNFYNESINYDNLLSISLILKIIIFSSRQILILPGLTKEYLDRF